MPKTISILPLDDRPVNYDYPILLGKIMGVSTLVPERDWLGNPWQESQRGKVIAWLEESVTHADVLILPIDALAYGGLIRMRLSHESFARVKAYLEIIREIKRQHPKLAIYASSVIQRVCRTNTDEEEMPYWKEYGSKMFRLSYLEHKSNLGESSAAELSECKQLKATIPANVYEDYLSIRTRNNLINRLMLDWLEEGVFDYLLFPQDDTAPYGWNISEARELQAEIRRRGLTEKSITYPGADETGSLLLAAALCKMEAFSPHVYPRYSSSSSPSIITNYEDRTMPEMLKAHLAPLNGIITDDPSKADFSLFINAPALQQGTGEYEWLIQNSLNRPTISLPNSAQKYLEHALNDPEFLATRREMMTPLRSLEEFTRAILEAINAQKPVAIADVAFVNGADLLFCQQLCSHPEIANLLSFGGWNTAGNTLGTTLAQAVLRLLAVQNRQTHQQDIAQQEFLFLHFLEDYIYQAKIRTLCMLEDLPFWGLYPNEERIPDNLSESMEKCVEKRLLIEAQKLAKVFCAAGTLKEIQVSHIHLPWRRLFEIGFTVKAN